MESEKQLHRPMELKLKFSGLENALNQALKSVQSLVVSAEKQVGNLSDEEMHHK